GTLDGGPQPGTPSSDDDCVVGMVMDGGGGARQGHPLILARLRGSGRWLGAGRSQRAEAVQEVEPERRPEGERARGQEPAHQLQQLVADWYPPEAEPHALET